MSERHSRKREKDKSNDFIVRLVKVLTIGLLLTDNVVYVVIQVVSLCRVRSRL